MRKIITALVAGFCCHPAAAGDSSLERQREAFREAYAAAELGNWQPAQAREELLGNYRLWPDLRAAYLKARLAKVPDEAIESFLEQYGSLKPGRELRYRHALRLAQRGDWQAYRAYYDRHYQSLGNARLDCLAARATLEAGGDLDDDTVASLWLVPHSQADECDPVFERLRESKRLGEALYRERFRLALDARQFSLARYLARSIDAEALGVANAWIEAQTSPESFLASASAADDRPELRAQAIYAIERIAYRDAAAAGEAWRSISQRLAFDETQRGETLRHVALWAARQQLPDSRQLLERLNGAFRDEEVRRWLARSAMRERAWEDVARVIGTMSAEERLSDEWRYWLAIALAEQGRRVDALEIFYALAGERGYYGFLAADELEAGYAWQHAELEPDEELLAKLAESPALLRARELFHVGLEGRGRSEWQDAVAGFDDRHKTQAALLANRWDWHSQAIAMLAEIGRYDDLSLRYPLPYRETFEEFAAAARIPHSWAYGVARSESLFMADVRSHAGAVGLMQVMPSTARRVARDIRHPYAGLATLTDPVSNIRLGTSYLGAMLQRFGDNLVLATAAYNAGPVRVETWRPESGSLDARIWIENIPYNETRSYVRRVLTADAIFHWRLTGETRRLSTAVGTVGAADERRVAGRGCTPPASSAVC